MELRNTKWSDFCVTCRNVWLTLWGFFVIYIAPYGWYHRGDYAFLVHPRGEWDIWKPFPFFRYLGKRFTFWASWFLPPILLSSKQGEEIIGLKTIGGKPLTGLLIATVNMPSHMQATLFGFPLGGLISRWRAVQAGLLAEKLGARHIGLGAYLPSLTKYGKVLQRKLKKAKVTTGHSTTAHIIVKYVQRVAEIRKLKLSNVTVAIVGANGSTGRACVQALAHDENIGGFLLIDLPYRLDQLEREVAEPLRKSRQSVVTDYRLESLRMADIVITVTTAPGTIIKPEDLAEKAVVIDDSQPRNTSPEILNQRPDVTVVDVLAEVPGLDSHFDFNLVAERPDIAFTCLAEVAILAAHQVESDWSVGYVTMDQVMRIAAMARVVGDDGHGIVGVKEAPLCSFGQLVTAPGTTVQKMLAQG